MRIPWSAHEYVSHRADRDVAKYWWMVQLELAHVDVVKGVVPQLVKMAASESIAVMSRFGLIQYAANAAVAQRHPGLLMPLTNANPDEEILWAKQAHISKK